jgi:hypothetical protein
MKSTLIAQPATSATTIGCYTTPLIELTEQRQVNMLKTKKMWRIIWIMSPAMKMREKQWGSSFTDQVAFCMPTLATTLKVLFAMNLSITRLQ